MRFVLVLIVALAVPVQGFAAVSAGVCMALGHHGGQGHSHAPDARGDVKPHHGDAGHGSCGPCLGCCASAAIASTAAIALSAAPEAAPAAATRLRPPGVQPAPLERPPLAR